MNGKPISHQEIKKIMELRKAGYSIPEIKRIMNRGSSTVLKYIKGIKLSTEAKTILKYKQGGSRARSILAWEDARRRSHELVTAITKESKIISAAMLYWAEGAKKDFSLSNTDPDLIKTFVSFLNVLGITKDRLRVNIRIYEDLNQERVIEFWLKILGIPRNQIVSINILKGKKIGKLKYGMCRVRIVKGGSTLKLIKNIIELVKQKVNQPS